ncbi:hypothetical protein [Pedobacter sp. NJ-S-72]
MRNKFLCVIAITLFSQLSFAQTPKVFLLNADYIKAKKEEAIKKTTKK